MHWLHVSGSVFFDFCKRSNLQRESVLKTAKRADGRRRSGEAVELLARHEDGHAYGSLLLIPGRDGRGGSEEDWEKIESGCA